MHAVFGALGLSFLREAAVDGQNLAAIACAQHGSTRGTFKQLSRGEIACFLSHRACWQRIANGDAPFGAVFEDDVHLSPGAADFLSAGDWIPDNADIIKLETFRREVHVDREVIALADGRSLMRLRSQHVGAAGYILRREAARRLLTLSEKFSDPVDLFLFNPLAGPFDEMTIYQLSPAICVQDWLLHGRRSATDIKSLLQDERSETKPQGVSKVLTELRRPLQQLVTRARLWRHRGRITTQETEFR